MSAPSPEELQEADRLLFELSDLNLLNPWTIDGRYPADHEDVGEALANAVLEAAKRVVAAVRAASDDPK